MRSIEDYREELAEKLEVELERLHFEVQPGSPPRFDVLVDGKDLTPEQEQVVVAFVRSNPGMTQAPKRTSKAPPKPSTPKVRCQFCKETSVDSARVGDSLRYIPYCKEHKDQSETEAARILALITRPCRGCGAPAPFFHHKSDCPKLLRK